MLGTPYWNDKMVMFHLEEAADIHRRMPQERVGGYYSLWPEMLKDDWRKYYDLLHGRPPRQAPMPPEVSYHEHVMLWLRHLLAPQQKLVWSRANKVPWKVLVEEFERSKPTLWREHKSHLEVIAAHLSHSDGNGETTQKLRKRAIYGA